MLRKILFLSALVMAFGWVLPANADYFMWKDSKTGLTVSFPDNWKQVNGGPPDDMLVLALPSADDHAVCRVRSHEDRRFLIYPNHLRRDVQLTNYSKNFWDEYLASFDNVQTHVMNDGAGLGRGFASFTVATYTAQGGEIPATAPDEFRAGMFAVAPYYDRVYVADCSSTKESFGKYKNAFLSFFKTFNHKKAYHELTVGNYRDFLKDWGTIEVLFPNAVSTSVY